MGVGARACGCLWGRVSACVEGRGEWQEGVVVTDRIETYSEVKIVRYGGFKESTDSEKGKIQWPLGQILMKERSNSNCRVGHFACHDIFTAVILGDQMETNAMRTQQEPLSGRHHVDQSHQPQTKKLTHPQTLGTKTPPFPPPSTAQSHTSPTHMCPAQSSPRLCNQHSFQ